MVVTRRSALIAAITAALLGGTATAVAQFSGQIPNNTVLGNTSGAAAPARPVAISTFAAGANPTASVGPSAVNGVATTFLRSDAAPALANTAVTPGAYTHTSLTVDAQGRLTAAASGTDAGITQLTGDVTAGPGSGSQATTLANTAVTPASYTLTSLTVDSKGRITAASNGVASQRVAIGWPAGIDPTGNIIATIDQASTVTSIVGTVTTPLGADGTVLVYKAPSATACASGTLLHTGSFNANGSANTNQTLTLAGAGAPSLSAGDRICLDVTDDANWATGAAVGGITVRLTTP